MKKLILLLLLIPMFFACSHGKIQKKYLETQKELAKLKMEKRKPLVDIETPDGYHITVQNPYKRKLGIKPPQESPGVKVTRSIVGFANSPVASMLGYGFATQMILDEATGKIVNSNNDVGGDMGSSQSGDVTLDKSNRNNDSSDNRQNYNNDKSDNSDNRQNYNNDSSDNRQDYNNDESDNRQNYNNDLPTTDATDNTS